MKYIRDFPTRKQKATERIQASAAKVGKNCFFRDITQRVAAVPYRRFGTTYRSPLRIEPETSARIYHYSLHNNPEKSSSQKGQLHRECGQAEFPLSSGSFPKQQAGLCSSLFFAGPRNVF